MDEESTLTELELETQIEVSEADRNEIVLATVSEVSASGVTILLDGESSAGSKEYKANAAQLVAAGDRVKVYKNAGTYVIEYVIGAPMTRYPIPAGGQDGNVLVKDGAADYKVKWAPGGGGGGSSLVNGNYTLQLGPNGTLSATNIQNNIQLGSASIPFKNCYIQGDLNLGASNSKIGFFGHTPAARVRVPTSSTLASLISALQTYGLVDS